VIALLIIASLLLILLAGTTWILYLVVKRNEDLVLENTHLKTTNDFNEMRLEMKQERIDNLYRKIRDMEQGSNLLTDTLVKEHEASRAMFERIIARLLQKQDEMIAGGGGSADPEDLADVKPLTLVSDG
jgi:hypothetical protein